jgi:hypothetical protein
MRSTKDLDDKFWQLFADTSGKVEAAAKEALRRIGWDACIFFTRLALRRGSGAIDATCIEVWCVNLAAVDIEVRHCLSMRDSDPMAEMVNKFAASFEALRHPGDSLPVVTFYEGMEATSSAMLQFQRDHAGHNTSSGPSGNLIVTRCFDCNKEFVEDFTQSAKP